MQIPLGDVDPHSFITQSVQSRLETELRADVLVVGLILDLLLDLDRSISIDGRDARRWRCMRFGSTLGTFAMRANNERTVSVKDENQFFVD
jgi:hypothetical protein